MPFQAKERKCLMKIELGPNFPEIVAKVTVYTMLLPTEGARETRGSGGIKEITVKNEAIGFQPNMDESDIVDKVLKLINKIAEKF